VSLAQPSSNIVVTATVLDPAGDPVEDATVNFGIASQPAGNAATITPSSAQTNSLGIATATLFTGNQRGLVTVSCGVSEIEGEFIAEVAGSVFVPPPTGDAGLK
jgi:hypothetical protein